MLKGHVAIELTNVETGKKRTLEADNMVTNAIEEFVKCCQAMSGSNNAQVSKMTPMATKLLGGLYVFSDSLVENANNIRFPITNKLRAFCGSDSDNTNPNRGSYNTTESGATSTGYKHVWDFTTSQANGVISALSLTHESAGKSLAMPFIVTSGYQYATAISYKKEDSVNRSILYKDKYLYYLKTGTTRQVKVCKRYEPFLSYNLTDDIAVNGEEIEVLSYTGESSSFTYTGAIDYVVTDGKDYAYFPTWSGNKCRVVKISLSDFSMTETEYTIPWSITIIGGCRVCLDGYLYTYYPSTNEMYIVNLNDTSDNRTITLPVSMEYSTAWNPSACGLNCMFKYQTNEVYIIYSDGTIIRQQAFSNYSSFRIRHIKDGSLFVRFEKASNEDYYAVLTQYLATIFNLQTPITKTAADTMKIIYTLTDA